MFLYGTGVAGKVYASRPCDLLNRLLIATSIVDRAPQLPPGCPFQLTFVTNARIGCDFLYGL